MRLRGRFEEHFIEKIKGGLTEPAVALQDVPQAKENKLADECRLWALCYTIPLARAVSVMRENGRIYMYSRIDFCLY